MHVVVMGAGVVGVTTAWYLRQQGHDVTVIDRQAKSAAETSHANGGQISVSHAEPWANPPSNDRLAADRIELEIKAVELGGPSPPRATPPSPKKPSTPFSYNYSRTTLSSLGADVIRCERWPKSVRAD